MELIDMPRVCEIGGVGTTPVRFRLSGLCTLSENVEGNVQGEDEARPKKKDLLKMTSSSALHVEPEVDSDLLDGLRKYALAPHVQEQIGRRLAAIYDEILRQPIPERFRLLLDQLDEATKTNDGPTKAKDETTGSYQGERRSNQGEEGTAVREGDEN